MLEVITRAIEIECLPDEIPEHFVVDVTELMIGQSKRAGDRPDRIDEADQPARSGDRARGGHARRRSRAGRRSCAGRRSHSCRGAEPEVIKKGKKEEEAAAETKGKKK